MADPMLLQEVERFILKHPLSEGRHVVHGKDLIKTVNAGVEHRMAFKSAAGDAWIPFAWTLAGLVDPQINSMTYRPDLAAGVVSIPDDDDMASLALWLLGANR
ncbi:hypothetical protein MARCHEWKA_03660 [Brevundimonas phage vB_BpoS-Marchewka]|uniref:Uncharacterized protein n=1 Tax=Brevundimonas phage vB_BpoS-Marchewka TaxID=2948604 RepID=A0A9E7SQY4_9CAUD|nr:hypothetical protein MARCHEWKA_03660 [Brevundimonas phage vB_BpoS-Marchewka]UTC29324.1 hypothetical protein BAMBUS_02420 [Brevundimonas phage vB_BpoS-Bambus]